MTRRQTALRNEAWRQCLASLTESKLDAALSCAAYLLSAVQKIKPDDMVAAVSYARVVDLCDDLLQMLFQAPLPVVEAARPSLVPPDSEVFHECTGG